MKFSMKVSLGILAILGLSVIYFGDDYFVHKKEEQVKEISHAIFFDTKDVVKFSVKNKNGLFTFSRDTNLLPWKIISPVNLSADQDTVNNILASIQQLSVQQEIANTENMLIGDKKKLNKYGLDVEKYSVSVVTNKSKELKLFIGQTVNFSNNSANSTKLPSVYAINPDKRKLLLISDSFSNIIDDKSLLDFRSKRISDFKAENVFSIELKQNENTVVISKNNGSWEVVKPFKWPGDSEFISNYLSRYQGMLAQNIYENYELNPNILKKFNLEKPSAIVSFKDSSGKILQSFNLGITKDGIYSSMKDGSVAKISLDMWPELVPKEKFFRNRLVLLNVELNKISKIVLSESLSFIKKDNNWYKISSNEQQPSVSEFPNQDAFTFFSNWELMTADDMIFNPSISDLASFGITKPLKVFSFEFNEKHKFDPIKIIIGNRVPNNEKRVYLKRSDSSIVYIVEAGWLSLLAQLYSVDEAAKVSVKKQME